MSLPALLRTASVAAIMAFSIPTIAAAQSAIALDDPSLIFTAMQITPKSGATRETVRTRVLAMRDYQRKRAGYIENAVMESRNPDARPLFVGIARWRTLKEWEALWMDVEFQKIVKELAEVADFTPGSYAPVK